MPAPKRPQDHKSKQTKGVQTFVGADGKTYTLPAPTTALEHMTGRDLRDALLSKQQQDELALGFRILERCQPERATLDALYDLPLEETLRVLGAWMPTPNAEGTTLPQS